MNLSLGYKEKVFIETQFGQVKSSVVYELVKTVIF